MIFNAPLFRFIQQEKAVELKRMVILALLGGLSSTGLLALINDAASVVASGKTVVWQFFAFVLLLFFYMWAIRQSSKENVSSTQTLMHIFQMRIMNLVLKSDLKTIDELSRSWILQTLVRDTQTVSQSILQLIQIAQSAATFAFLLIYIAIISLPAFFTVLFASILIFALVSNRLKMSSKAYAESWHFEGENHKMFGVFLDGFKEIKMNSKRAAEISQELVYSSRKAKEMKTRAMLELVNSSITPQFLFYALVASAVFILPVILKDYSQDVQAITTSIMFLIGALGGVVQNIPPIAQANASAEELFVLEKKLEQIQQKEDPKKVSEFPPLKTIELKNIVYQYDRPGHNEPFNLGPINTTFESGKIYFVRGSNGSGKTTLIRILIGLYTPLVGSISFNGETIDQPASSEYRNLFSVIFSDFYLFKKLYGLGEIEDSTIKRTIDLFGMSEKIEIENNIISDIELSTGQKKRVALISAILENKQVIVLDEWAADQDPEFRKYFYEFILPEIKKQGKTVIAITHDDQYFNLADHILEIDKGVLVSCK